jgi:hypothetical protein
MSIADIFNFCFFPLLIVLIAWLIHGWQYFARDDLTLKYGLRPSSPNWKSMALSPLFHFGADHIVCNSKCFVPMGIFVVILYGPIIFVLVILNSIVVSNLGIVLFGSRFSRHAGLSLKQANACLSERYFCSAAATVPAGLD